MTLTYSPIYIFDEINNSVKEMAEEGLLTMSQQHDG
jgi:hypothetical protein